LHPFKKLVESELERPLDETQVADYLNFYDLAGISARHRLFPIESCSQDRIERLMVQIIEPLEPLGHVFMCHGYYDHVGLYGYLIRYLLSRGLIVITFDQPGHGLTSGEPAQVDSFDRYVQAVVDVLAFARTTLSSSANDWHWVGQSMGGAVLMEYFARETEKVNGDVVLFAPLVRPFGWGINRWVFAVAERTIKAKKRVLTKNADNQAFLDFLSRDPLQADVLPVSWVRAMVNWFQMFESYPESELAPKIIQGEQDKTVAWQHNRRILKKRYPQSEWLMLPSARHHLVNESADLRMQMWRWLDNWLN
jgi:alpha-beta hydrolase superfamily lysophospholipase